MKTVFATLGAVAALAVAGAANAATIVDFNELGHNGGQVERGSHVTSGGMSFDLSVEAGQGYLVYGRNDWRNADPGGAALMSNLQSTTTRVTRTDKGVFDLLSLDMADYWNQGQLTWVQFDFTDTTGATSSELRSLDSLKGLQTLAFNKTGLKAFDYTFLTNHVPGSPGWGQIDNVAVNFASAVPEPTTWALMIAGFGGVGGMLRRQKRLAPAIA